MAYTKEQLKVYLSLTDEQLRTLGHDNIVKHREVAQAWVDGKEIQYFNVSRGMWRTINVNEVPFSAIFNHRIKPEPTVNVNINGREMSYYPPDVLADRVGAGAGFIVIRDYSSGGFDVVRGACPGWMWSTEEKAQQFANVLNALLYATPNTER